jgi:CRISPR-associated helicase Cas3/CRISPR-associated endonuclease Cas3-HD
MPRGGGADDHEQQPATDDSGRIVSAEEYNRGREETAAMALTDRAAALWAKTGARSWMPGVQAGDWHPLACHVLDSAAAATHLWESFLAHAARTWLSSSLGGEDSASALVCWLAGLHDWGKATPLFQSQSQVHAEAVRQAGLDVSGHALPQRPGHAHVSAHLLSGYLHAAGWPEADTAWAACVVGGHHGVFPPAGWRRDKPLADVMGGVEWDSVRREFPSLLYAIAGPDLRRPVRPPPLVVQLTLAGLVILADWLASTERLFPYECGFSPAYPARAEARAARIREEMGLRGFWNPNRTETADPRRVMAEQFGGKEARPVQLAAHEAARADRGPGLLLIEAPMGEGKTEAALLAAEVIAKRTGANGLFVGLPTQATANQMFGRVTGWLAAQPGAVTVTLAHGKSSRNEAYQRLMPEAVGIGENDAGVTASQWLAGRKRRLLAPVVVGTVDQLLLAGVASRHVALRFLGLTGKVVIIDEVHAYDAYMSVILRRVLAWLGAARVPVILLSATLPASTRAELLGEYAAAAVPPVGSGYPRVTWVDAPAAGRSKGSFVPEWERPVEPVAANSLSIFPAAAQARTARVDFHAERDETGAADLACRVVAEGGCVLVLRNTVGRAQRTYEHVAAVLAPGEVTLAHARFTVADRRLRDRLLIERFGPDGTGARPSRHVVVATQVAEQSLDIDFDLLISDLAPVDLLLQRLGRVHRHSRPRPPHLQVPRIVVAGHSGLRPDRPPAVPPGCGQVYGRYLLWRTAAALAGRDELDLPADIPRLVDAVYGDDQIEPPQWQAAVGQECDAYLAKLALLRETARTIILPDPGAAALSEVRYRDQGEAVEEASAQVQAHVRFGPPTIEVILLRSTDDPGLAHTVSRGEPAVIRLDASDDDRDDVILDQAVRLPAQITDAADPKAFTPSAWRGSPGLSEARVMLLPADGSPLSFGNYECTYSPEMGLQVVRR